MCDTPIPATPRSLFLKFHDPSTNPREADAGATDADGGRVTSRCKTVAVPGFVEDLRFAQQARVAVEVTLFDGQRFLTGVHDVDEQVGTVNLYEPQTFSDATTRRRVQLADITSVVVTEIDYTVD